MIKWITTNGNPAISHLYKYRIIRGNIYTIETTYHQIVRNSTSTMASKSEGQTENLNLEPVSEQVTSAIDSDSEYDTQSLVGNESHGDEGFSADSEGSDLYGYGYLEVDLSNTQHSLNTGTTLPILTHSLSELEPSYSSPTVPSLSPLQIHAVADADQTFPTPILSSTKHTRGKRSSSPHIQREAKRLEYHYNPSSIQVNPNITVAYMGETDPTLLSIPSHTTPATIDPTVKMPVYYQKKNTDWESRDIFNPDPNRKSPTGLPRMDLFVYAVEANTETRIQRGKSTYRRNMQAINTQIERFYPDLWHTQHAQANNPILSKQYLESLPYSQEPYANALSIIRTPENKFKNIQPAIEEPIHPLHTSPPAQQHFLSEQGRYLLDCTEPIQFFEAISVPMR